MVETSLEGRVAQLEADNARLRHLLDARNVPAELRHQVRNTLGLVRAILRRSAESQTSVQDHVAHLEGRFDAILRVQSAITRGPVEGADLHAVLSSELLSHLAQEGEQVRFDGPDIHLQSKTAELMGLAFHELATNSVKFGALSTSSGTVDVSWTVTSTDTDPPFLHLVWQEKGASYRTTLKRHQGFGTEVLERMLAYQINAQTSLMFGPDGLRCSIGMPFPRSAGFVVP